MLIGTSKEEERKPPVRRLRGKHYGFGKTIRLIILLSLVLGAAVIVTAWYLGSPVGRDQEVAVKIAPETSTSEIAALLEENGLIHSAEYFKFYAHLSGADRNLKPGTYSFSGKQNLKEIIAKLQEGSPEVFVFTIPEGYTLKQICNLMDAKNIVPREEMNSALEKGNFDFPFIDELPEGQNKFEGFLFPDTYKIGAETNADEVVQMMLDRFCDIYGSEYIQRADELGMSTLEVITLASIIEREAKKAEERPLVSAVFHNRLKKGMLLQSCATVQYALGEVKPILYDTDLQIDSPYNTYLNPGLPPGPIAVPGEASIKAALYPSDVSYLYFVAKPDGSHVFSNTLEEHNAAKNKYIT